MRLKTLKINNLASLRGEHQIDFEKIFRQSPLMAITGETGAGKSTILNALSLVLYGEIYKKQMNQTDIITLGEKEASVELVFNLKGKEYLAIWQCRIKRANGELLSKPLTNKTLYELYSHNEITSKVLITKKPEEILNLSFEQFTRCLVLNQGEFSKFILSSFKERKDILERLYPGEILENISSLLKKNIDTIKQKKFKVEIELDQLSNEVLTDPNIHKSQQLKCKNNKTALQEAIKIISFAKNDLELLGSYQKKQSEIQVKISQTEKKIDEQTTEFNQIQIAHLKVEETHKKSQLKWEQEKPQIEKWIKWEEKLKSYEKKINADQEVIRELENSRITEIDRELSLSKVIQENELVLKDLSLEIKILDIDKKDFSQTLSQLKSTLQGLEVLEKEILLNQVQLKNIKNQISDNNDLIKTKELTVRELTAKLNYDNTNNINTEIEQLRVVKQDLLEKNNEKIRLLTILNQAKKNEVNFKLQKEQLNKQNEEIKSSIQNLSNEIHSKILLENQLKLQIAINTCRDHLVLNQQCPVCESIFTKPSRPSKITPPDILKTEIETLEVLKIKNQNLNDQLNQITYQINKTHEDYNKNQNEINDLTIQLSSFAQDIDLSIKLCEENELLFQELNYAIKNLNELNETMISFNKRLQLIEPLCIFKLPEGLTRKLKEYFIINFEDYDLNSLILFLKNQIDSLVEYNSLIGTLNTSTTELKNLTIRLNLLNERLNRLKKEHIQDQDEYTELKQILLKELPHQSAIEYWNNFSKTLKDEQNNIEQSLKLKTNIEMNQRESKARLTSLHEQLKDLEMLIQNLILKLRSVPTHHLHLNEDLKLKWQQLNSDDLPGLILDYLIADFNSRIKNQSLELEKIDHEIGQLDLKLKMHESAIIRFQEKNHHLEDIQKELLRLDKLFSVLGNDDLRLYMLSLVEEQLIYYTNQELKSLCQGRYEILHQQVSKRFNPEFYIIDKYKDSMVRKISTLSGGETFMVSLAFALGLAEMSRGQADIESLFIDEGFGSLDIDSLNDVMEMLNQIYAKGLNIGLISHVSALTNKIPINIHLLKNQAGSSKIDIIQN